MHPVVVARKIALYAMLSGCVCLSAVGQPRKAQPPHPLRPPPKTSRAIERLSTMPPAQRERMLDRLPPQRRERLERQLERYNNMTPAEREQMHRRLEAFEQLPPDKQENARRSFRSLSALAPDRQVLVRQQLQKMRKMTPEERQAQLNSDDFRSRFNENESEVIRNLSDAMPPP